jgi:hypothetical protein
LVVEIASINRELKELGVKTYHQGDPSKFRDQGELRDELNKEPNRVQAEINSYYVDRLNFGFSEKKPTKFDSCIRH